MKNASQIITSIQYKPQFRRVLEHKCTKKLRSTPLKHIRNYIKNVYIKNNILKFELGANLNRHDLESAKETIKMILGSKMLLESQQFIECNDVQIDDVEFYVNNNPKKIPPLHVGNKEEAKYKERASGEIDVDIHDKELKKLAQSILEIIKRNKNNET
jgi:hypothetical protein